jgi:hypothetical protein
MKKIAYLLLAFLAIIVTSCFDTTQETSVNDNGSGTLVSTTDLSNLIGMMKQFGGDESKKIEKLSKDTTIALATVADSIEGLTPKEKALLKDATLALKINIPDEKFIIKVKAPFSSMSDIPSLNAVVTKAMNTAMKKQMNEGGGPMGNQGMGGNDGEAPQPKSFDDYFVTSYSNGLITKKLDKAKYSEAENDQYLKSMKEMSGMGAPMTVNYIFNLPRPAKKVEGKGVKLSDDKKKVTMNLSIDDFFDSPEKFEYSIEH